MRSRVVLFVVFGLLVVACSRGDRTAVDGPIAASTDETTTSTERLTWPIASFVVPEEERSPMTMSPEDAVDQFLDAWRRGHGTAALRLFSVESQRLLTRMAPAQHWDWFVAEAHEPAMLAVWADAVTADVRADAVYVFDLMFAQARRLGALPIDVGDVQAVEVVRDNGDRVTVASGDLMFVVVENSRGQWRIDTIAQDDAPASSGGPFLTIATTGSPNQTAPVSLRRQVAVPSLEEVAGRFLHAVQKRNFEVVHWSLDRVAQGHIEQSLSTFDFREFPTIDEDAAFDVEFDFDEVGLGLDFLMDRLTDYAALAPLGVEPPADGSIARAELDESRATVDVLDADGNHVSTVHLRRGDDHVWRVRQLVAVGAEPGGDRVFVGVDR